MENPSAINENTHYPSEAEGLIANPSEEGLTFVPIPPAKSTINTTSLPQTIIKSLNPESVRVFQNETRALKNANVSNAPSHRLADAALATMSSIIYDNPQWWPEGKTPFYLQPLSSNEHCQYLYHIIDTHINDVIEILKEIFPLGRTKGLTFLATQNLLPPTEIATEAKVHQWAGTFSQYANNGKLSIDEVRQIVDFHKKAFPGKTTIHNRSKRLLYPSNEKDTAPLQSYMTRVGETLTKEAKKVRNMQK